MFQNTLRSTLIIMCSAVLTTGCASTNIANKLTDEERSSLRNLVFIAGIEEVGTHDPYLKVTENYIGKTVSVLGSGGETMSISTYKSRTAQAVKDVEKCLFKTYGDKKYAPNRFKFLLLELMRQNSPFSIEFVSEVEQEQFFDLSEEGKVAFIKNHNADAALIMRAYHMGGLNTHTFGVGTFGAGYTGLYARIDDYQSVEFIYSSNNDFTKHVRTQENDFCNAFITNFESAVDEHTTRWYYEIIGTK